MLDIHLPGKTGWDAINDLKANEDTSGVPVIICSIEDDRERGQSVGVAEYLIKPIIEDDLVGALSRVISGPVSSIHDVLIIDSDESYASSIGEALRATYGCNVRIAGVGAAGLDSIQHQRPDVVILDLDLPDMDGYGLLIAMRSQPGMQDIPVVILTARDLSDAQLERLDEQTTRYLNKAAHSGAQVVQDLSSALHGMGK